MNLKDLCKQSHEMAKAKGWWDEERNLCEMLMLAVCELAEAAEEYRKTPKKTKKFKWIKETDDWLSSIYEGKKGKPEGFPIEIADVFIRLADLCHAHGVDIEEAIQIKMKYNATRPYRHGGKKA